MPKVVLGTSRAANLRVPTRPARITTSEPNSRVLLKRSRAYVEAVARLDAGGHIQDRAALESLVKAVAAELPELTIGQRPLGLVCRCFLGAPYIVHICDLGGQIVQHYETYRSMPAPFEPARELALNPAYAFVEVCLNELHAISPDGTVSVVSLCTD